ncbi:Ras-specific guanine nucleotide-releasing factor RalGPS1 [Armadillidium nasatum]|uniref:Ras-specific guanine nucleotide-releasing factor RalGPS1 n=1 Tax=Armadillidium nasatum TaxID=96803 RepID=A0A5N5TBQ9_9CRUS|nr:Ras-specific guanine nucleotide-releasing factor RalGPS1 [Armadillidium nasatum]
MGVDMASGCTDYERKERDLMKYSDNHKNLSCEKLLALRIAEDYMDSDDGDERESRCSSVRGMSIPMCTRGTSPPSSVYKKVATDPEWDTSDGVKALTKAVYSYGYSIRMHFSFSFENCPFFYYWFQQQSTGIHVLEYMLTYPGNFPILEMCRCNHSPCRSLAVQRTLPRSQQTLRRTTNFTSSTPKQEDRSKPIEILKVNPEELAAQITLMDIPIFRLSKTWASLSKKDRASYEKMAELFSEHNNWEKLRAHVNSLKLPMIPYLGLFLTDIVYIDMAHPHFGGLESEQRQLKMNNILRVLADYQLSDYSHIKPNVATQKYLSSVRYIEELQKFVEDDHYKLSLRLEPNTTTNSLNVSKDSLTDECNTDLSNGSPTRAAGLKTPPEPSPNYSCPTHGHQGVKFIPGHRKARSLGTKFRSLSLPRNLSRFDPVGGPIERIGVFKGIPSGITDGNSTWDNRRDSLSSISGISGGCASHLQHQHDPCCPSASRTGGSRHLLDDSEIEPPLRPFGPPSDLSRTWSEISSDSDDVILELNSGECGIQGPLKRKTILKDGKKPKVSAWHRYWVQLWGGALVYYHPKSLTCRGLERIDFKTSPCKLQPLNSPEGKLRIFEPMDSLNNGDTFQRRPVRALPTGVSAAPLAAPAVPSPTAQSTGSLAWASWSLPAWPPAIPDSQRG